MAEPQSPATSSSVGRAVAVVVCLALAAVLLVPGGIAYWAQRTLNDTGQYVDTVGPLVKSPEVQEVIATEVTDALSRQVDLKKVIEDLFADIVRNPAELDQFAGPLSAAIEGLIEREVRDFVASSAFADFWDRANTRAQQLLHLLLVGDSAGPISIQGGKVVLDLSEVISEVRQRLAARGLTIADDIPIPDSDRQIVLADSPTLDKMRAVYALVDAVETWLLAIAGILFLLAFAIARRRAVVTVAIGAIIAVDALLLGLLISVGRQLFIDDLADTSFAPASRVFYDTVLTYLIRAEHVYFWLGVVLVAAGWFAGQNRYGSAVRSALARGLAEVGSRSTTSQIVPTGRWVGAHATWLRAAIVVLGAVVLAWGNDMTTERLWWSLALVLFLLAVLQVLIGTGAPRSREPAEPAEPVPAGAP